ncbi:hypothetical protein EST38_g9778 [Candolleomyces aberdarensis]|uniref:Peptidase S8/S53 domain-containing protein n=1 Tax=Candolleomyces aberdarensis TaxID=2316362 RepID=A0A4Q2DB98_9AGAR|nr:hypothetical protein EST38_g9778 [Candolleomyces aberdarensis]
MLRNLPVYLSVLTLLISSAIAGPTPPPYRTQIERYNGEKTGRYIVTLKEGASRANVINQLAKVSLDAVEIVYEYGDIINGFAGELNPLREAVKMTYGYELRRTIAKLGPTALTLLQALPNVETISEDGIMHTTALVEQTEASWGLARLSSPTQQWSKGQDPRQLNFKYTYDDTAGAGVDIYVVDTGIQINHTDFGGRAQWGATFGAGYKNEDGHGHGTHVAGTAAGTTYGVAKAANIVAVKVLSDTGSGSISDIIAGLIYVAVKSIQSGRPTVVNMSLGGGVSPPLDLVTKILTTLGIHVVVAAGNSNADAQNTSPAHVEEAITVGASTIDDERASFSNFGSVVDVFAPGRYITSAWIGSGADDTFIASGTSMASPHVAGLVAYLINLEGEQIMPEAMETKLKSLGVHGALTNIPSGTANILAQNGVAQP